LFAGILVKQLLAIQLQGSSCDGCVCGQQRVGWALNAHSAACCMRCALVVEFIATTSDTLAHNADGLGLLVGVG
jgi:hypothetical protein